MAYLDINGLLVEVNGLEPYKLYGPADLQYEFRKTYPHVVPTELTESLDLNISEKEFQRLKSLRNANS